MGKRVRHTEPESEKTFRRASELVAAGATIAQACRKVQVSEATFHRWRKKFAPRERPPPSKALVPASKQSIPASKQLRLKQLEMENKRLKLLVAELTLENAFLKDRLEGIEWLEN